VEEFDTLLHEAEKRSLVVADILTPVMEPQVLRMREAIGRVGTVMSMRSAYYAGARNRWYVNEELRGNFYSSLTIHQIIYYNGVLGESPDWVEGSLRTETLPDGGACAIGSYMCHYPSGVQAFNDWGMGFDLQPFTWTWEIEGTDGRLVYERVPKQEHQIRLQRAGQEDEVFPVEKQATVHAPAMANFVEQVLDGAEPFVSHDESRHILRICEAALEAARSGRRVSL
jgi:predicted dehydrogenase